MVRPRALQSGSVSAGGLRAWTVVLAAVAVLLRLAVHFGSGRPVPAAPAPLAEYLRSPEHIWSSPPLPGLLLAAAHQFADPELVLTVLESLAAVVVVALLVRLGDRWLDYRVGLLAAATWAACGPAIAVFRIPGSEGWQAALAILCAASMLRVARRRAPVEGWRIGASAGVLTLFSGGGGLWALVAVAWLPMTSQRFRGRGWFALAGVVLAGWLVVILPVVVRNAVLTGGELVLPMADELARGAGTWAGAGPRLFALLGGWLPDGAPPPTWALPWPVLVVLAWGGVVALLPGARFLFPLLLGGLVALLRGAFFGADAGTVLAASPFIGLYAGYAVWRGVWGRRSAVTWIVLPAVCALAVAVHFAVRGWG